MVYANIPLYIHVVISCTSCGHLCTCTSPREPHLVNLYECTLRAYPRVHLCVCTSSCVHLYVCTSSRVHLHMCTSPCEPHLVSLYTCTAPREPHLMHISCISRAPLHVHLISCAPIRVHLISRAPHLACTSRASFALVHQLTSCTHQTHPPSRWTWTVPSATVTFWPSALSISCS